MNGCNIRLVQGDDRLTLGMRDSRRAFTLIEMLTVIAIIGILAAILVPTIAGVVGTAKRGALKLEVDELARAIERYRDKYGDYPPDGSDWATFQRHIRKVFPQILSSEVDIFNPARDGTSAAIKWTTPAPYDVRNSFDTLIKATDFSASDWKVMDPAEALVFFLGGFSSDPKRPFTGRGGPFVIYTGPGASPNQYQYNVARENALFNFDAGRLTIGSGNEGGVIVPVVSTDESLFHGGASAMGTGPDLLPTYLSKFVTLDESSPYVYFDSRTYVTQKNGYPYFNFYQRSPIILDDVSDLDKYGSVYPYFSDTSNSSNKPLPGIPMGSTMYGLFLVRQYMEPTKFQVIGPGLDGKYGGRLIKETLKGSTTYNDADVAKRLGDTIFSFPSGTSVNAFNPNNARNQPFRVSRVDGSDQSQEDPRFNVRGLDNVASFSATTLEAGAP